MIVDGLDVLREQLSLADIMRLIEKTARWVSRDTFEYLPIWYPEEGRNDLMYKANWSEPQTNKSKSTGEVVHKRVGNSKANTTLTNALGMKSKERPNWTCCHIWSVDDPGFQKPNIIARDKRYYSCVANMLLLPTPLKAFTDSMPAVKTMLRVAAFSYYNWAPDSNEIPSICEEMEQCKWESFPESWPREQGSTVVMPGMVSFNEDIKSKAKQRIKRVKSDLLNAGSFYPKDEVRAVLRYWSERVPAFHEQISRSI